MRPIGIVAAMMYQPIRARGSERSDGSRNARRNVVRICHRSLRKNSRTAASVPSCVTAVNAAPGSSQPKMDAAMRWWALEEMGKNSVRPCTRPRTIASKAFMRSRTLAAGVVALGLAARRRAEGHVDLLEAFLTLGLGLPGVRVAVALGEVDVVGERRQQRPGVQVPDPHDVDLGAEQDPLRRDVDEGDQP